MVQRLQTILPAPTIPAPYAIGASPYSVDSPWWCANRLKLLCDLNYPPLNPTGRGVFDQTERWEMVRQQRVEVEALTKVKAGRDARGIALLPQFINDNSERAGNEYRTLNQTLPGMLASDDTNCLYTDYLKVRTSQKGVTLPLHCVARLTLVRERTC